MKKTILYIGIFLLTISLAFAASVEREVSGDTVTYKVNNPPSGSWGVLIEDNVDGCTPDMIATGWLSPQLEYSTTVTGTSCTFTGTYQFATSDGVQPEGDITGDGEGNGDDDGDGFDFSSIPIWVWIGAVVVLLFVFMGKK